jgi:hypothetical protein
MQTYKHKGYLNPDKTKLVVAVVAIARSRGPGLLAYVLGGVDEGGVLSDLVANVPRQLLANHVFKSHAWSPEEKEEEEIFQRCI